MQRAAAQARDVELQEGGLGGSHEVEAQTIGAGYEDLSIDAVTPRQQNGAVPDFGLVAGAADPPLPRLGQGGHSSAASTSFSERCFLHVGLVLKLVVRIAAPFSMVALVCISFFRWPVWMIEDEHVRSQVLSTFFAGGVLLVALENVVGINKSSMMLMLAATMWAYLAVSYHPMKSTLGAYKLHQELDLGLQETGSVVLFLLPAMVVVESIDHFRGFAAVTRCIRNAMSGQKERLLPIICIFTFILSSVVDNLTATVVALKLLRHVAAGEKDWRLGCGGCAVIAANAGGAWSPIGDVTTTMLWVQGRITTKKTIAWLLLPSLVAGVLPLCGIWWQARARNSHSMQVQRTKRQTTGRHFSQLQEDSVDQVAEKESEQDPLGFNGEDEICEEITAASVLVLVLGIFLILMVPALKMWTALPPYLGMFLALGLFWVATDAMDSSGSPAVGVVAALHKVDLTGLLFFMGVLLAVGALNSAGVLRRYAVSLVGLCGSSPVALCTLLGLSSAVVDNVPLVQATIDMFKEVPCDDPLWQLISLAAGTGGSILSIGSIAGVTLMSMEHVGFIWYFRRIGAWAFVGFAMAIATYQLERVLFG